MKSLLPVLFTLLAVRTTAFAERGDDSACNDRLIRKHFVFKAQWAAAYSGERRQLSPPYELLLTPDSLVAYLPFYGRVYSTPTPEELRFMAIEVASRSFTYKLKQRRSGSSLSIALHDNKTVRTLDFSVSRSCWCTLWIRSATRDPMMYEGTIGPPP